MSAEGKKTDTKWIVLDFIQDGEIGVEVKKLPLTIPAYSLDVLGLKRDGRRSCHLPVKVIRDGYDVTVDSLAQRIEALVRNAEDVIRLDAQAAAASLMRRGGKKAV